MSKSVFSWINDIRDHAELRDSLSEQANIVTNQIANDVFNGNRNLAGNCEITNPGKDWGIL
jgi:hypothetical protein